ncbi:MAG TPA: Ser-Thr-rich GPI-anchored membrane family protein [Candidatus Limnocylindrales bacterium]|nr:Ser-Thr-rich GPI-anchored membrane family protein [Candidatus Limnocylindrales bacterium]
MDRIKLTGYTLFFMTALLLPAAMSFQITESVDNQMVATVTGSPTSTLTIISPIGGENWQSGSTNTIVWNLSGIWPYVRIELLKGSVNSTLTSNTSNNGSHRWLIPAAQAPGTDYRIKITGAGTSTYTFTTSNYFTISSPAPSIAVLSPNRGENWTRGTTQTIKWNSTGNPGAYVKIELMKAGVWKSTIILSTPNDGSHPWLIPVTQIPGTDYKIKITSTTNAAYTDTSDNTFTIPTPNITVSTPKGGETWRRGTTQTIKWNSSGSPGAYVKIELMKAGVANRVIIAITPNDGTHPWLIPATQTPGTDYKVRITSTTNASYNDTSDNSFTIPAPSFTVVSPNSSDSWIRGTTKTIRWNSTESPGSYVKIELLKAGVSNRLIIASTLNDGSHPWLIPAAQIPGTDYKVRVTSTVNVSINDTSDNPFTIPAPSFTVLSPNGSQNWTLGTTQTILWNSTESPGTYVKIELLKAGMTKVLIASTLNDGSHPWLIPATQIPGADYKIKVSSTANVSNNDTSDKYFSIIPPKITVTFPNGGENWRIGTPYLITWNYTGNPGTYVKIELLKNGLVNRTILTSTPNDKSQSWIIPATQAPGADYKIRITSTTNLAYNDTSDGNFNISSAIP